MSKPKKTEPVFITTRKIERNKLRKVYGNKKLEAAWKALRGKQFKIKLFGKMKEAARKIKERRKMIKQSRKRNRGR